MSEKNSNDTIGNRTRDLPYFNSKKIYTTYALKFQNSGLFVPLLSKTGNKLPLQNATDST
jgi:hypothetical protein